MDWSELVRLDRAHVWHPYAPMPGVRDPLIVTRAEGVRLTLADGRELVDGMSSWWAAIHGYRHPVLDAAVRDQVGRMSHVMFGGLTHEPAVRLCTRLVALSGLDHVFLCDSGSVSVEVAIKMCLQYQRSRGRPGKHRLMTWRGGYHGDTFGAMSVCDPDGGMHALWRDVLPRQVFAGVPPAGFEARYVEELARLVEKHADELAAAVAGASVALLLGRDWRGEVRAIEAGLRAGLAPARAIPGVVDVRVLGAIGVVQLDRPVDVAAATAAAVAAGVWLRPFRDLIYTMPPYVTGDGDLKMITEAVGAAVAAATGEGD